MGVVQIDAGGMHVVALTRDNKILTWGVNDQGALGRDTVVQKTDEKKPDEKKPDETEDAEMSDAPKETKDPNRVTTVNGVTTKIVDGVRMKLVKKSVQLTKAPTGKTAQPPAPKPTPTTEEREGRRLDLARRRFLQRALGNASAGLASLGIPGLGEAELGQGGLGNGPDDDEDTDDEERDRRRREYEEDDPEEDYPEEDYPEEEEPQEEDQEPKPAGSPGHGRRGQMG